MDLDYLLQLQHFREVTNGFLDTFFEYYSLLVIQSWFYVIVAGIYWCFSKKLGQYMLFNMIGSHLVTICLKNTFCVYRPWIRDPNIVPVGDAKSTALGFSFPSGHSSIAAAIFGSPAVWFRKHKWFVGVMAVLIFLVMFSRNYLGVHTPQDVVVGCGVSCLCLFINWKVLKWADAAPMRDIVVAIAGTIITAAFLIFMTFKSYPLDYGSDGKLLSDPERGIWSCFATAGMTLGLLCGWVAERHFVKFSTAVGGVEKLIRFVVGASILYALSKGTKTLAFELFGMRWGRFVWQFLPIFTGIFLWPLAFQALHRKVFKKNDGMRQNQIAQDEREHAEDIVRQADIAMKEAICFVIAV